MAQVFDPEVVNKINAVTDFFRSDLFGKMKSGIESAGDCANSAGSPKLVKSCEAASEATESMIKVFESVAECCDRYAEQLKRLENAI